LKILRGKWGMFLKNHTGRQLQAAATRALIVRTARTLLVKMPAPAHFQEATPFC
jgi:hypothetical protein